MRTLGHHHAVNTCSSMVPIHHTYSCKQYVLGTGLQAVFTAARSLFWLYTEKYICRVHAHCSKYSALL